jgi:hypothetical protein
LPSLNILICPSSSEEIIAITFLLDDIPLAAE